MRVAGKACLAVVYLLHAYHCSSDDTEDDTMSLVNETIVEIGHAADKDGECYQRAQSPINIQRNATVYNDTLSSDALILTNFDTPMSGSFSIVNEGHTVQVTMNDSHLLKITGGSLGNSNYSLLQFHFHWGGDDTVGSEHTIDMRRYPLEMHMLFQRDDIDTFEESLNHTDGLTAMAVLFEIGDKENKDYKHLLDKFMDIEHTGNTDLLTDIKLGSFLPNHLSTRTVVEDFYTYMGSLTTFPCSEAVVWNILPDTVKLTEEQFNKFRSLKFEENKENKEPRKHNFRELQDLNNRSVQRSFEPYGFGRYTARPDQCNHVDRIPFATKVVFVVMTFIVSYQTGICLVESAILMVGSNASK